DDLLQEGIHAAILSGFAAPRRAVPKQKRHLSVPSSWGVALLIVVISSSLLFSALLSWLRPSAPPSSHRLPERPERRGSHSRMRRRRTGSRPRPSRSR